MLLHNTAADCQSQASPTFFAGIRGINLVKALEDTFNFVGRNTPPLVLNLE
jgi:hypothetical protein